MSESTAPRLGRGDIELLRGLVMTAGQKAMKQRRKASKRKDKAAVQAHMHMAEHLARVHIKLSLLNGEHPAKAVAERVADLLSTVTGVRATVVGPGDPEHELLQKLREKEEEPAPVEEAAAE